MSKQTKICVAITCTVEVWIMNVHHALVEDRIAQRKSHSRRLTTHPLRIESVVVVCELAGAQNRLGHLLPGWSP